MANWISRETPSLAAMPTPMVASSVASNPEYGDDVVRFRTEDAGSLNGIELWTSEVAFDVGRRLDGISYLQTDGQGMHDGGRDPRKGSLTTEWFGGGWERRAAALLYELEHNTEVRVLRLPYPWGALNARCRKGGVKHDPSLGRATIVIEFEEVSALEYVQDASRPPTTSEVLSAIPADQDDLTTATEAYLNGIFDSDLDSGDLLNLLLEMRTQADLASESIEASITADNVADLDGIALALAGATKLFPDREVLSAAWV